MPHARFDCLVHKFPAQPMPDKCKVACDKCYCWLCDDVWTKCKDWSAHCVCDGKKKCARSRTRLSLECASTDRTLRRLAHEFDWPVVESA